MAKLVTDIAKYCDFCEKAKEEETDRQCFICRKSVCKNHKYEILLEIKGMLKALIFCPDHFDVLRIFLDLVVKLADDFEDFKRTLK